MAKLLMRDIPLGETIFTITRLDDEIRETYYTRNGEDTYLHHGCIQGRSQLEIDERPRYFSPKLTLKTGYEYPLVPTLPVYRISESRFAKFMK